MNRKEMLTHDKIDVNQQNQWGYTALMLASQEGHDKTVEFLLKQDNINVHHENIHGETALDIGSQMWQYSAF
jgi:ankyrin repeat protein